MFANIMPAKHVIAVVFIDDGGEVVPDDKHKVAAPHSKCTVAIWAKVVYTACIVLASKAQWGALGVWLRPYSNLQLPPTKK